MSRFSLRPLRTFSSLCVLAACLTGCQKAPPLAPPLPGHWTLWKLTELTYAPNGTVVTQTETYFSFSYMRISATTLLDSSGLGPTTYARPYTRQGTTLTCPSTSYTILALTEHALTLHAVGTYTFSGPARAREADLEYYR